MSFELDLLIKSTVILACAFLTNVVMRRAAASTRHAIWAMALLCILALPAVSFYFPKSLQMEIAMLPEPQASHDAPSMEKTTQPAPVSPAAQRSSKTDSLPSSSVPTDRPWRAWLLAVWLVGLGIVLLRTALAMVAARGMAAQSASTTDDDWIPLLTHLRHELGVKPVVDLRIGGDLSPMTWGFRNPIILLPSGADSWSQERREAVLTHELAHVKRRDGVTQILVQLVCSIYWFNPAVWFAERRMRTERERACDDYVLNRGVGAAPYADHLLEIATGSQPGTFLATVSMAQPSQLETRLRAILSSDLKRGRLSRWSAAALLSGILALVISLAAVQVTTLLSLPLPAPVVPAAPVLEAPAEVQPAPPIQQPPPTAPQQAPVNPPDNERDLLGYLEALAASRGVGGQTPAAANRNVAVLVVMDRSGSMAGRKMDLAREGAKAALSLLRDTDLFGVLSFGYDFEWPVAIAEARNRQAMEEAINSILATGNTNIYYAMREGFQRLQAVTAGTKHIILMSDGQTPAENFHALVSDISNNKITVSTIAVTAASNPELLGDIAMWGKGRSYYVENPDRLPEIFQKEVSLLVGTGQQ